MKVKICEPVLKSMKCQIVELVFHYFLSYTLYKTCFIILCTPSTYGYTWEVVRTLKISVELLSTIHRIEQLLRCFRLLATPHVHLNRNHHYHENVYVSLTRNIL